MGFKPRKPFKPTNDKSDTAAYWDCADCGGEGKVLIEPYGKHPCVKCVVRWMRENYPTPWKKGTFTKGKNG